LTHDVGVNNLIHSLHISIKGNDYGIGHAFRQKNLILYASNIGWNCRELIFNQNESIELTFSKLDSFITEIDLVFIDLDPRFVKLHQTFILSFLHMFRLNNCKIILFDNDLNFSINKVLNGFIFDFVFCPYVNLGVYAKGKNYSGFGLSVFSPELERVRNSRIQEGSEFTDVLISCGGSDPFGISLVYLEVLEEFFRSKIPIKIVIGEEFAIGLVDDILNFSKSSKLDLQIVEAPPSIYDLLRVSSFVLTTGGLTRTESIYAGVPALVVDINLEQSKSTQLFAELGAVYGLGVANPEDYSSIKTNFRNFLHEIQSDSQILPRMTKSARLAIDSNGANFILKEIADNV